MIKIITVGQIKEKYLQDAIKEYKKRLSKYTNIEVIEVKDEGLVEEVKAIKLEAEKIKKHINDRDYIVTLEIEGKQMTSVEFANKIDNILIENSNVDFIIGGSYGLSDDIKNMSRLHLSFSKMTFPHQLFRVLLLEQIYRAYKINNNESYHK
ncbi:MAG: 23S rRNA (pseudouridine(1915)-N(3))-methyltransferase RlmH [Mollicutes bacterium]|nr:23S rRNA (pseudouridine(1915)-N(3))-methyltransferase RlmH [Mollicutes bacterium]MDY5875843.1 23S rRNA (pseudouridine(1915)-N(3))-methyltransferase RlmH [Bacilli bacterium]